MPDTALILKYSHGQWKQYEHVWFRRDDHQANSDTDDSYSIHENIAVQSHCHKPRSRRRNCFHARQTCLPQNTACSKQKPNLELLQHKHAYLYIMHANTQTHTDICTHTHTQRRHRRMKGTKLNGTIHHPWIHNIKETETLPSTLAPTQRTMSECVCEWVSECEGLWLWWGMCFLDELHALVNM